MDSSAIKRGQSSPKETGNRINQSNKGWLEDHEAASPPGSDYGQRQADRSEVGRDDDCVVVDSDPLIPEGVYIVKYLHHATSKSKGKGKLAVHFEITQGEYSGTVLRGFYPVITNGKTGPFGKFQVSKIGTYFAQMSGLFPDLANGRSDRVSPRRLQGQIVEVEVETVKHTWSGERRKPHVQYSVVRKLLRLQR